MRTLCNYSFLSMVIHFIHCQYQGMNHEIYTNISLSQSEGDPEMVSYIYTKTYSIVWINTPKKILLKIQEIESLGWNINNQNVFPVTNALGLESSHGSGLLSTKK